MDHELLQAVMVGVSDRLKRLLSDTEGDRPVDKILEVGERLSNRKEDEIS